MTPSGTTEWAVFAAILALCFLAPFGVPLAFWLSDKRAGAEGIAHD